MHMETLVAMDMKSDGTDIQPVIAYVKNEGGDSAFLGWVAESKPHWRDENLTTTIHRVCFDADKVRNTYVHGAGFRAGFVCHVEPALAADVTEAGA